jgi:hypothetical protein
MIQCPQCRSLLLELTSTQQIATGDGTPVRADSYVCRSCAWSFFDNTVIGPTPDPTREP